MEASDDVGEGGNMRKEITIVNIYEELNQCTLEEYENIKPILLAVSAYNSHLMEFMKKMFILVDAKRPLLIEMKGGVVE